MYDYVMYLLYKIVEVAPPTVSKVVDTTGAGDAFLGGLIVAVSNNGMPSTEDDMRYARNKTKKRNV